MENLLSVYLKSFQPGTGRRSYITKAYETRYRDTIIILSCEYCGILVVPCQKYL